MSWLDEHAKRASEPLDPELEPWVEENEIGWTMLRHPLVYDIPFSRDFAYRANDQLAYKRQALVDARTKGNWSDYVFLHERPWRADALFNIQGFIKVYDTFWKLFGEVWTDTENLHAATHPLTGMLESNRKGRNARRFTVMTEEEQAALAALPDAITIYRGYAKLTGKRRGWAWTTDLEKARWFARRFAHKGEPRVVSSLVSKADVIAYFTRRGESEIVINPKNLRFVGDEEA